MKTYNKPSWQRLLPAILAVLPVFICAILPVLAQQGKELQLQTLVQQLQGQDKLARLSALKEVRKIGRKRKPRFPP